VYSRVPIVTAASLIALGALIAIGVPAVLPTAGERPLVAIADASRSTLPWIGGSAIKVAGGEPARAVGVDVVPAAPAANPPESLLKPSRLATASPQEFVPPKPAPAISIREEAPQPAAAPQAPVAQQPAQPDLPRQSALTTPAPETPVRPAAVQRPAVPPRAALQPPAKERHAARPAAETPAEVTAPRKMTRRDRPAKRPTSEALNTVRKFGDNLQDIPVNSYAADGTPKRIVIRPTSIQDVYYYSSRSQ
jgi:hypothetical protein